jgi:hypothetical protein
VVQRTRWAVRGAGRPGQPVEASDERTQGRNRVTRRPVRLGCPPHEVGHENRLVIVNRQRPGTERTLGRELSRPQLFEHRKVAERGSVRPARREQSGDHRCARQPIDTEHADIQLLHPGDGDTEHLGKMRGQRVHAPAPVHARQRGVKGRRWRAVGHNTNAMPPGGPPGGGPADRRGALCAYVGYFAPR